MGQPVVNTDHKVPFVGAISNSWPKAFSSCHSQNILLVYGSVLKQQGLGSGPGGRRAFGAVSAFLWAQGGVCSCLDLFLETFFSVLKAGHAQ